MIATAAELVEDPAPRDPPPSNVALRRVCNFMRLARLCGKTLAAVPASAAARRANA